MYHDSLGIANTELGPQSCPFLLKESGKDQPMVMQALRMTNVQRFVIKRSILV